MHSYPELPDVVGLSAASGRSSLDEAIYAAIEAEARARLRDPAEWPVLASALALAADIWTNDYDFLGTGVS